MVIQRIFLLILLFSFPVLAEKNWSHDELREKINKIEAEQSVDPKALLDTLDSYIDYGTQRGWKDIEILAMSQKANIYSILQQLDETKAIIDEYLPLAERLDDLQSQLNLLSLLLQYYDVVVDKENAAKVRVQYEAKALAYGNQQEIATMYADIAQSIQIYGEVRQALMYLQKALKIFVELDDLQGKGSSLNSIAALYDELADYEQAIEYYKRAIALHESQANSYTLSVLYFNIGQSYYKINEFTLSLDMMNKALKMSEALKDEVGEAYAYRYIGKIDFDQSRYPSAYASLVKALNIFQEYKSQRMIFITSIDLSMALAKLDKLDEAIALLAPLEDTAQELNRPQYLVDYYHHVYELEKQRQNYLASLSALEKERDLKQAMYDKEKEDSLQELMLKFDTSQREADYKLLEQQNQLKQLRLTEQGAQRTILILAFSFAILIGLLISFLLFKQIQNRNRFKYMAMRDELTGAPNRRAILTQSSKKFEQCQEEGSKLTIAILDIDNFKTFNDTYGHDIGDLVLQVFSDACRDSLRSHDRYGRYGGEEWLLVVIDAQEIDINMIFNRLRERLSKVKIKGVADNVTLTFSLGAASILDSDTHIESIIKRADENLYKAKAQGRDQYVISN
ncbi:diguanylate cyclase [Colwelliaceae bacterium 6471]